MNTVWKDRKRKRYERREMGEKRNRFRLRRKKEAVVLSSNPGG